MPTIWEILAILVVGVPALGVTATVPLLIWTYHRRKMEELRLKGGRIMTEDIRTEFATLRAEIRDLRDTTMQYDLSFDTALQQMERRVEKLERSGRVDSEAPTFNNVSLGGR
jgi:uncharacterized protein YlxW (UPF0749 family)